MSKYNEALKRLHELRAEENRLLDEMDDIWNSEEIHDEIPKIIRIGIVSKHLPSTYGVFTYDVDPSIHLYPQVLDAIKRAQTESVNHIFRADPADAIHGAVQRDDVGNVV